MMAEMPEIVRSRLAQKTMENSAHPDANLLAAFAERTLPEREHAAVVAHLVECGNCRECVALAAAAAEPESTAAAERSVGFGGWFREWRWGVSAATACCVVATALLYYSEPPARVAPVRVSSKPAGPEIDPAKTEPTVPLTVAQKKKPVPSPGSRSNTPVLLEAKKELAAQNIMTQPPPATSVTSTAPAEATVPVRLEAPQAGAVSSFVERGSRALAPPAPPKQAISADAQRSFGAQPAMAGPASGFAAGTPVRITERPKLALKSAAESPRVLWSINASPDTAGKPAGVVQRSTDAGQSWQSVPVSERVSFRSVATSGTDVWAGGSEGKVFHSADGGAHWTEIKIADEKGRLSGDIVRIDVRGPNQVTITTASDEVWTSGDGEHWTRE